MRKQYEIKKVGVTDTPRIHTAEWDDYIAGVDNGEVSPPVDYTIKGQLIQDLCVGEMFMVARSERNGVERAGIMTSSRVTDITRLPNGKDFKVVTGNSVYHFIELPEENDKKVVDINEVPL